MSIQHNPAGAVSTLLNRLYDAAAEMKVDLSNESVTEENQLVSVFRSIEDELQKLKANLCRFRNWEDILEDKFTQLRFHVHRRLSNAKKSGDKKSEVTDALRLVRQDINELNEALKPLVIGEEDSESSRKKSQHKEARKRRDLGEWRELHVEKIILDKPAVQNLQVSYQHLDEDLRLCFLFLSVFPENAEIKKRPLIYWWIGEGLITQADENHTAEEMGEQIFQKLIKQGLLIPFPKNLEEGSLLVNSCKMHPWIRLMAISLAHKAKLFDFDSSETPPRRACLALGGKPPKEENLLTVFNASEEYLDFDPAWLLKLKKLVVFHLGRWCYSPEHHIEVENDEFLKGLGAQKHLKYLSLRGISRITKLPQSIIHLFSLEILDLKACHNLEELPSDIGSLRSLTHLDVSDCRLLESIPKGLEKLTALQVLKGFVTGNKKKTPCQISDLAKLMELRRLGIFIGKDAEIQPREFAKLKDMAKLRCLTIWWGVKSAKSPALGQLSFPPQLEKLDLRGFPQPTPPEELKATTLTKLKRLYIRGGKIERLDNGAAGEWKVEILRIRFLENFKLDWKKLKETFPDLRYLELKCGKIVQEEQDFVLRSRFQIEDYYEKKHNSEEEEKSKKEIVRKEIDNNKEQKSEKEDGLEVNASTNKGKHKVLEQPKL